MEQNLGNNIIRYSICSMFYNLGSESNGLFSIKLYKVWMHQIKDKVDIWELTSFSDLQINRKYFRLKFSKIYTDNFDLLREPV